MNAPEDSSEIRYRGAVIGAALFCAFAVALYCFHLELPPSLVWLILTFSLSGGLVGYFGMRTSAGAVGASLGLAFGMLIGAVIGDEAAYSIPMEQQGGSRAGEILEISGETLDGKPFDVRDWRGKVVLVDFWATWCGPCVAELPNVKQAYDHYHKDGFEIVGIPLDDNRDNLVGFLDRHAVFWPQIFSNEPAHQGWNSPPAKKYGISAIPAMYLLDKNGVVVPVEPRGERLAPAVEQLLGGKDVNGVDNGGTRIGLFPMGLLVGACIGGYVGLYFGDLAGQFIRRKRTPAELS